jgi:hypothetical protein
MSIALVAVLLSVCRALRMLPPLIACVAALAQGTAHAAGDPERTVQAFVAYESGRIEDAQRLYLLAAEEGDARAAYNVAVIRLGGETDHPSEAQALGFLPWRSTCSRACTSAAGSCRNPRPSP